MDYFWIWITVLVVSVIVEIVTEQFISIWFVPASIVSAILDICNVNIIIQSIVFLVVAILGIVFLRKIFMKYKKDENTKTNIEAIVGENCIVTEKIDNFAGCGQAKVKGQIWSARGIAQDDVFEEGEVLRIVAIEGVKLICKKE